MMRALFAFLIASTFSLLSLPAAADQVPAPASLGSASTQTATVAGIVVDRRSALAVSGATVEVRRGTTVAASTTTDGSGRYSIAVTPGIYAVLFRATGYQSVENDDVATPAGSTASIDVALTAVQTNSTTTLSTIGTVSVSAHTLSAATSDTRVIDVQDVANTGQIRISDALGTLPATNWSTSSSVGDDASINLRGLSTTETAVLLDGHPVGPLGAGPVRAFDFSLGPAYGLSEAEITYGSGAQGLFGSDTIGGAVDFITLSPTQTPHESFQQQIGGFGILSTGLTATGTYDRLGYALALGRLGEYGDFSPHVAAQSARPNNVLPNSVKPDASPCPGGLDYPYGSPNPTYYDVSACNLALNSYYVSQNTEQTVGLLKLDYAFSPATHFKATTYGALQWSDSTGNGDNDFLPYSTRLGQILSGPTNCNLGGGGKGYAVATNPAAGETACYTAAQFAAATSGPDGGGQDRQRSNTLRDYDFSFTTKAGINNVTISAFADNYQYWKNSSLAGGVGANGAQLGSPTYAQYFNTQGYLASDEIDNERNSLSFGYTLYHQLQNGNEITPTGLAPVIATGYFGVGSGFVRENYTFSPTLTAFLNAWIKHDSVSRQTTFDPRFTLQIRPTHSDVVQFTFGHSDGAPSPQLGLQGAAVAGNPGASLTNVTCDTYNSVTTAGNPNLRPESANDFEIGLGHRFSGDSNVQLNGYVTSVTDQLFSAQEPLTQYGVANVTFQPGALETYLARLQSQCPGDGITAANISRYLSVSTTYNAANALARGIELSGRQRFARIAYIDYGYFVESSTQSGINPNILASNPNVINGAQVVNIPLQTATVSFDVAPNPWEFRIDNYYVGSNNGLNRPAYWYSNAFLSRKVGGGTTLTLGGTNIFNQAVAVFGYIGYGTAFATNAYGGAPTPSEEFGIAPAQLTLTLQQKI